MLVKYNLNILNGRYNNTQVTPTFEDNQPSCGASFLWWQQAITGGERLWDLARNCTENIRRESDQLGGLTFWARLHAAKTLPELASASTPPYSPPYTVNPYPSLLRSSNRLLDLNCQHCEPFSFSLNLSVQNAQVELSILWMSSLLAQ